MQIESLKLFCELVEAGSFAKVAQKNHITRSAMSQQMSNLERRLGSKLVERGEAKVRPTREGQILYEWGKQITDAFNLLQSKMEEVRGSISGVLRIAAIPSIGLYGLPPFVDEFAKEYSSVDVRVQCRRYGQIYQDILANRVDVGLVSYAQHDANLELRPIWNDPLVLIVHPQNPLATQRSVSLDEITDHKMILFAPDPPTRQFIDHVLEDQIAHFPGVMAFDCIEMVKAAVAKNLGISILPRMAVEQEVANRVLTAISVEDETLACPSSALFLKGKEQSPALREFLALLTSHQSHVQAGRSAFQAPLLDAMSAHRSVRPPAVLATELGTF